MKSSDLQDLAEHLADRRADRELRRRFAPELSYGRQFGPAPRDARPAAVLILLYPHQEIVLPLTLRPPHLPQHAGQICLPGGLVEPDETSQQAALRELDEELGVRDGLQIIGRLSELYVFVSGFRVTPWLAVREDQPTMIPNPDEVSQVIEVPLAALADPNCHQRMLVEFGRMRFYAPCFAWREFRIWGATSMILGELIGVIEQASPGLLAGK
ncbi:MAG: CoA pyrophosphatase [Pirellulales bacterium]